MYLTAVQKKSAPSVREEFVMSISGENIRNIAIVGHSGEGKTTLCEAMLFAAGAIDRQGKVSDGNTVSDFDDIEKAKKMCYNVFT